MSYKVSPFEEPPLNARMPSAARPRTATVRRGVGFNPAPPSARLGSGTRGTAERGDNFETRDEASSRVFHEWVVRKEAAENQACLAAAAARQQALENGDGANVVTGPYFHSNACLGDAATQCQQRRALEREAVARMLAGRAERHDAIVQERVRERELLEQALQEQAEQRQRLLVDQHRKQQRATPPRRRLDATASTVDSADSCPSFSVADRSEQYVVGQRHRRTPVASSSAAVTATRPSRPCTADSVATRASSTASMGSARDMATSALREMRSRDRAAARECRDRVVTEERAMAQARAEAQVRTAERTRHDANAVRVHLGDLKARIGEYRHDRLQDKRAHVAAGRGRCDEAVMEGQEAAARRRDELRGFSRDFGAIRPRERARRVAALRAVVLDIRTSDIESPRSARLQVEAARQSLAQGVRAELDARKRESAEAAHREMCERRVECERRHDELRRSRPSTATTTRTTSANGSRASYARSRTNHASSPSLGIESPDVVFL